MERASKVRRMREHMHKKPDTYDLESIENSFMISKESVGALVSCHLSTVDLHDNWDMVGCPIYLTANFAHLCFLYYTFAQYDWCTEQH